MPNQVNVFWQLVTNDVVVADRVGGVVAGLKEINGNSINGIASMTWADFVALDSTQLLALAVKPVHISDVHNNVSGIGGSYVVRCSSPAGWAQISGPMYFATFDLAPNPATYPGWRIRVGNCGLGGADMIARGGYWRYINGRQLVGAITDLTISSNKSTEQSAVKVPLPINNGKSLIQNGDSIVFDIHYAKSGTTNRISRDVRLGADASTVTNNTSCDQVITGSAANIGLDEMLPIHRVSATSLLRDTPAGFSVYNGVSTTVRYTAVAVSNLDSALQYLDLTMFLTGGTSDTMTCTSAKIFIDHGF